MSLDCENSIVGGCSRFFLNINTGEVGYRQGLMDGTGYEVLCVREGVPVEQVPPDCSSAAVVFTDHGDGTVTASNGLTWEQQPSKCDYLGCKECGEGWRLPDISELRSLVVGCERSEPCGACPAEPARGTCQPTDDSCFCADASCRGCTRRNGTGHDGTYLDRAFTLDGDALSRYEPNRCVAFWSTSQSDSPPMALTLDFHYAALVPRGASAALGAWCVRSGE